VGPLGRLVSVLVCFVAPLAGVVGFAAVGVCSLAVVDVFGVGGDGGGYGGGGAESSRRLACGGVVFRLCRERLGRLFPGDERGEELVFGPQRPGVDLGLLCLSFVFPWDFGRVPLSLSPNCPDG